MSIISVIVWFFPIIFMLHDFEEIIFVEAWRKRYKTEIQETKMKKIPFSDLRSTASFSIGVWIEFVIFSILALLATIFNWYFLWNGLFFGFTLHFIIHIILSLQFKHYVPGVTTSIIFLPICMYLLFISNKLIEFTGSQLIWSYVIGSFSMFLMVEVLHRYMQNFENFIRNFAKDNK